MRAPLSIVIPTLDAADELPATLAALGEGLQAGLIRELVISDGGSRDATRALAHAAGAILVEGPAGRGRQLARGAAAAEGEWLLFLHADTWLGAGWAAAVLDHMARAPGRAGYFRLRFRAEGLAPRAVGAWANLRARAFALPFGDQGLLIRRSLYEEVGGYPPVPLMEDVALVRALGRRRLRALPAQAHTSAARYEAEGWLRRGAANMLLMARAMAGADPELLARRYRRTD